MIEETKINPYEEVIKAKSAEIDKLNDKIKELEKKWAQVSALTVQSLSFPQPQRTSPLLDPQDQFLQSATNDLKPSAQKLPNDKQPSTHGSDTDLVDSDWFDENMREIFNMVAYRQHYQNVHVVFRRDVKMRWDGKSRERDYFGEWSRTTDKPHGRGIWFGPNGVRVGYLKNGQIARGKVLTIATDKEGIEVLIGTEEDKNGKTKFKGRMHPSEGKCVSGTWIDGDPY